MTQELSSNNKRIAKNTVLLYFRMFFLVVVKLYASRVILVALGVQDYGTYTAVGGIVAMFSVLTGSLSTAISRFITFELGKTKSDRLNIVFSNSVNVLLFFGLMIIIFSESLGLWFLNAKMNIPEESLYAANIVFQFSVATFLVNFLSIPYNALIIAHEKMSAFAYVSILEVILQLSLIFVLFLSSENRLILYSGFIFVIAIIIRSIYGIYCKKKFREAAYEFNLNKDVIRELMAYAGWNVMGASAWVLNTQGVNLLTNIFFNVFVNAARGIVGQIEAALAMFVNNFITAIVPQITKAFSLDDVNRFNSLVINGTKFSAYIVGLIAIPMFVEMETILSLWLDVVPAYTLIFAKITVVSIMFSVLGNVLHHAVCSVGKVKVYQILVSITTLSIFLLTWLFYVLGYSPVVYYTINAVVYFVMIFVRLFCLKRIYEFDVWKFFKSINIVAFIWIISTIIALFTASLLQPSFMRMMVVFFINSAVMILLVFSLGISRQQRTLCYKEIEGFLCKKNVFW